MEWGLLNINVTNKLYNKEEPTTIWFDALVIKGSMLKLFQAIRFVVFLNWLSSFLPNFDVLECYGLFAYQNTHEFAGKVDYFLLCHITFGDIFSYSWEWRLFVSVSHTIGVFKSGQPKRGGVRQHIPQQILNHMRKLVLNTCYLGVVFQSSSQWNRSVFITADFILTCKWIQ